MSFKLVEKEKKLYLRSKPTETVVMKPAKAGPALIISRDIIERIGLEDKDKVVVLIGENEDAGFLRVQKAEEGMRGRALVLQGTQARFMLKPEIHGFIAPQQPTNLDYDIVANGIEIDMKPLGAGTSSGNSQQDRQAA